MPQKPLSEEAIAQAAMLYNEEQGDISEAARRSQLPYETFRGRLKRAMQVRPDLIQSFDRNNVKEALPTQERTVEDDVKEQRAEAEARALKARHKDATKQIADLEDRIKDLEWAAKVSYEPAKWSTPARKPGKSEHMPYLLTSDFHVGEVVRADETEAGYGYDSETFVRRYRRMIDTSIYLSFEHSGQDWQFPGFIYARGGDTISGKLHPELAETDDMSPLEAVQLVAEQEMGGLRKLADAFGRVEVKSFGAGGNHDRTLWKPRSKNAAAYSYDLLVEYMLRREFNKDKRITFQSSRSFDVRFPIYDTKVLLTHGDRIGSRGGQGFIGPSATIMRGVQKVRQEQAALGHHIDQIHVGHFHYPMLLPEVISNGSVPGYTEYAKQFRFRPNPPQQAFAFFHPKRGLVDFKPIILTDA